MKQRVTANSTIPYSWPLYVILLFIRICVGPFLPGYVHPDEFFQGGQELWFGCPPTIPWEFEPQNALRSVVPPTIMSWIPLKIYSIASGQSMGHLSGQEVLIVPRIACALLSILVVDWSIWRISTKASKTLGVPIPVLFLASAWPTIVLLSRPFSNAMETYFVALLLVTVASATMSPNASSSASQMTLWNCVTVATLCALGLFTRFTYVFFAVPIVLFYLYEMLQTQGLKVSCGKVAAMALSFLTVASAIVYLDTIYYTSANPTGSMSIVLTPWNALSYNSKVSNLKDHGLHPRWTHGIVNMFLLYGPMTLVAYLFLEVSSLKGMGLEIVSFPRRSVKFREQSSSLGWVSFPWHHIKSQDSCCR